MQSCGAACAGARAVGRPAARASCASRARTWLADRRAPRWLTKSAGSSPRASAARIGSQRSSAAAAAAPTGTLRRLPPLPSTWRCDRRDRSSRGIASMPWRRAPPTRQCAGRSHTSSSTTAWSRARSASLSWPTRGSAALIGQRHRLVDRQRLGQRLGAFGACRPSSGLWLTSPRWPHQRYRPRHADSTSAMLRGASCWARRPASQRRTSMRLRLAQCHAIALRRDVQLRQRRPVQRQRARRQTALDSQVLQIRLDVGVGHWADTSR
mgnify:CR=1 FL=1